MGTDTLNDFAKIFRMPTGQQVLVTNLYDSDEDEYVVTVSYATNFLGGCHAENTFTFAHEADAQVAFDKINTLDDLKGIILE